MYTVRVDTREYKEFAIWLITIVIVAFGFKYIWGLILVILEELYHFFIQHGTK